MNFVGIYSRDAYFRSLCCC